MAFVSVSTAIISVFLIYIVKKTFTVLYRPSRVYPPGPKPLPVIGNLFDFPTSTPSQAYIEWGKKYNSDILYAEALGIQILVLNRIDDAVEVFENHSRARMYSDRPTIPIVNLMGWGCNSGLLGYGDEWRQHRKIAQQSFSIKATADYEPIQTKKIREMLQGFLHTPEDFVLHNKMLSVSLMTSLMYSYDVESIHDPIIEIADEALLLGTELLVPGGSLINLFPTLRYIPSWFPGAVSRKKAARVFSLTEKVKGIPMDFVKKSFNDGTVTPSLVTNFYKKKFTAGASHEEELAVEGLAYTVYGAASDTTISSTGSFFYLMVLNPEVQKKAQVEIDRVVGSKRLPTLNDRKSLPYIEAIYREVLRIAPPVPTSIPHCLMEDDIYKGYFIPKGTTILPNIWAMTHDEGVYPNPDEFRPERFLDGTSGNLNDDSRVLAYGFGRRICVGRHFASSTMWLIVASVLTCYTIEKARDTDGKEIEINHDYIDNGFVRYKKDFPCSFRVQSSAARNLVLENA